MLMTPPILSAECYVLIRGKELSAFGEQEGWTFAAESYDINYRSLVMDQFEHWEIKEYPDTLPCLRAVASGEADCYLTTNYQYNHMRRECERLGLALLATGKEADFTIAVDSDSRELYSILTRTTSFISDTIMNEALAYYTAEGAKLSLMELVLDNLPFVIGGVVVLVLLILLVIVQRRVIAEQRKVNEQQKQLVATKELAYKDPLTGVKSKHAFVCAERKLDEKITAGTVTEFSVGVFDLNDLKKVNDTQGHEAGDRYIREACMYICRCFQHSPVYRIGGDEFAVILEGEDYAAREELLSAFDRQMDENRAQGKIVVSSGLARFDPERDASFGRVFERADARMYQRKRILKGAAG